MAPHSVLVTGANRGIGLGLVREFLKNSQIKTVIATARDVDNAKELKAISDSRLKVLPLDANCDKSIDSLVKEVSGIVGDMGLNVLVNNAGIFVNYFTKKEINREDVRNQLETNVVSVIILTQKLLPLLLKASSNSSSSGLSIDRAAVLNISSGFASIADNDTGSGPKGALAYKVSKCALNQFTKTFSIDTKDDGLLTAAFCPGWVQTSMGGENAAITVEQSAEALVKSFGRLNKDHNGLYFNRNLEALKF